MARGSSTLEHEGKGFRKIAVLKEVLSHQCTVGVVVVVVVAAVAVVVVVVVVVVVMGVMV